MEESVLRRSVAEFVGTFTLIFIGGGAGIVSGSDIVAVALANGLAIGIMVSNLGHISGGHFNPAITLGFLTTRRIAAPLAAAYCVAQFGAAMNPARAFGPQLLSGMWGEGWIYYLGPIVGALLAALAYEYLYLGPAGPPVVGTVESGVAEPRPGETALD